MRLKPGVRSALVALLVMVAFGALFVISPPFKTFTARAKQGECHSYLRVIGEAEQAYFAKHGEFTESADALGVHSEQWYAYIIGDTVLWPTRVDAKREGLLERIPAELRQTLHVDKDSFTIACVADLDDDELIDVFTVSSEPREAGHSVVEAGRVLNHSDDVSETSAP